MSVWGVPHECRALARVARGTLSAMRHETMEDEDQENTCRIPREELLGLLNTMDPIEQQRITAEIPVQTPPPEIVVIFRDPSHSTRARVLVIAASFCLTFAIGFVAAML
jgi:hypothetical protein